MVVDELNGSLESANQVDPLAQKPLVKAMIDTVTPKLIVLNNPVQIGSYQSIKLHFLTTIPLQLKKSDSIQTILQV